MWCPGQALASRFKQSYELCLPDTGATSATILGSKQNSLLWHLMAWVSIGEHCPLAFAGGSRGSAILL